VEVFEEVNLTKEITGGVIGGLLLLALITAALYKVCVCVCSTLNLSFSALQLEFNFSKLCNAYTCLNYHFLSGWIL